MNTIGRILTGLIVLMSVVFAVLAATTFATHKNWKEEVVKKGGLKEQVEILSTRKKALEKDIKDLELAIAQEQAARRSVLATVQSKLEVQQRELTQREQALAEANAQLTQAVAANNINEQSLAKAIAEVAKLREEIRLAQTERLAAFQQATELTDKLNQTDGLKKRLEERNVQLMNQFAGLKAVADRLGINEETPVAHIPPPLEGRITSVRQNGLVEISLGGDEGLKTGHKLDVYRGATYVARIEVRDINPDRSTARVLKEFQKGQIQKGDNVSTKLDR